MQPIYLDHQATTPIDAEVLDAMRPYMEAEFGNPHSEHVFGWAAADAVARAAEQVAELVGSDPGEVIFTSGATEANNLAIQGIARSARSIQRRHLITSSIEHKCVLNTAQWLTSEGYELDIVQPDANGLIDPAAIASLIRSDTALVSIMSVNNEIGTVQPIKEIATVCALNGTVFHSDAAQAAGKIVVDSKSLGVDLLSLSGHKFYGPKGIGALIVSRSSPIDLSPLMFGGGQQNGIRPGTVPVFLCVGLGKAAAVALQKLNDDAMHARNCRQAFTGRLTERAVRFEINGSIDHRVEHNLSLFFPTADGDALLAGLSRTIGVSNGSACNAGIMQPSYVLTALGHDLYRSSTSIRFGFGRDTTQSMAIATADLVADLIAGAVARRLAG